MEGEINQENVDQPKNEDEMIAVPPLLQINSFRFQLFPNPPAHYKNNETEYMIEPNLKMIKSKNKRFYSFGKYYDFEPKIESVAFKDIEGNIIEDQKMELIKINKKILHIALECFEKAFQTPEILSHNFETIKNLIEKFFEITLYLRKTLEVRKDLKELYTKEIETINENKKKLLSGIEIIKKKLSLVV